MFTEKDIKQFKEKGVSSEVLSNQLRNFEKGFPYVDIIKPATINDGISKLNEEEIVVFENTYDFLCPDSLKFVPASGAASRMFKFLFEFYEEAHDMYDNICQIQNEDVKIFFTNLKKFAFYNNLELTLHSNNLSLEELLAQGRYKEVLKYFLFKDGLNYGQKPKGVLSFHKYDGTARTAFEEHLVEGIQNACSIDKKVSIHFTISPEHRDLFNDLIAQKQKEFEDKFIVDFEITFSQQKVSTDMIAVDLNNKLFRNDDGSLLFRPGGHGALIENLNDLDSELIFIKNIDNVVPDKLKYTTKQYKKALAGILLSYQEKIFDYMELLQSEDCAEDELVKIENFIESELCYLFKSDEEKSVELRLEKVMEILDRPIRVCGMVKNEGEPGGGPFWVRQTNGDISLQIIESSQIDLANKGQVEILNASTHFNPVDLVCATKNYKDEKFDLLKFRDMNTGFISVKSKDGKELKAQELPGLWNGAMANWNTIFVEVPIITFNPVKTINDLLRPEHQD